jgi:hypothetical protein
LILYIKTEIHEGTLKEWKGKERASKSLMQGEIISTSRREESNRRGIKDVEEDLINMNVRSWVELAQ